MRGDPCSSVYCGSICEDICSSAEEIRGAIGVTTSDCWSVGVVLPLDIVPCIKGYLALFFLLFIFFLSSCDDDELSERDSTSLSN